MNITYNKNRRIRHTAFASLTVLALLSGCGSKNEAATTEAPKATDEVADTTVADAMADTTATTEAMGDTMQEPMTDTTAANTATDDTATDDTGAMADPAADYDTTGWPEKLTFAAVPAENAASIQDYVTPQIFSDELGIEIEFAQAADYAGVIEGMIAERVDIGQFGPFSYVIATGAGAEINLAGVWAGETPDTIGDYRSYLLAPADSEIAGPADLAGKKVCFVDPGSTSGYLFPSAALLEVGLDPGESSTDIEPVFAGGHDASALAVADGTCDAGFAYDKMVTNQLIDSGDLPGVIDATDEGTDNVNPDAATVKIIWKSTPIAAPPMAFGAWLPETLQAAITDITVNKINVDWATEHGYCEEADPETCPLSDGPFWGYLANEDSYYDGIRELCELTGSTKCKLG